MNNSGRKLMDKGDLRFGAQMEDKQYSGKYL